MCDVAEIYLKIRLAPQERKCHCFLWRNVDQTKRTDIFESNSLVGFGVN